MNVHPNHVRRASRARGSRMTGRHRSFRRARGAAWIACGALALLAGCVTNPISGRQQFSLVGKGQLLSLAREAVPAQFSSDYGVASDRQANAYVAQVGQRLVATLKPEDVVFPDMPFTFQVVNAVYVNAYAFPDGTIAITRGMLAELENEAQLAAVLGHEIAHVNCGHTAAAMSRGLLASALIAGAQGYLVHRDSEWADLAGTAGQLGGAVVLAGYSRAQEREADQGGMIYMTRAGYDPQGMVGLTELLVRLSQANPSLLARMFATHPMSSERLQAARQQARASATSGVPRALNREAFLAQTAGIRRHHAAYQHFARAETELARQRLDAARTEAEAGLRLAPDDTVGLLLLAQARQQGGQTAAARELAARVAGATPDVARAHSLLAECALKERKYTEALVHLAAFEKRVPGDTRARLYQGLAHDWLGNRRQAAAAYEAYLRQGAVGEAEGQFALRRLQALTRSREL